MESDSSDTNLVIRTKSDRIKLFGVVYWRTLVLVLAPIILLPITFMGKNNAYQCFYMFLLTAIFLVSDVLHPAITALVPLAFTTILNSVNADFCVQVHIRNDLLTCFGVMILALVIEQSLIHRRLALKLLLIFGCSHFRLSFLLFFSTMFLSMWMSSTTACGLMMPLVKAILYELERMGILEVFESIGKARQKTLRHEQNLPRPTVYTVFYFLGIAYSSSIGGMATLIGSQVNQLFKMFSETMFEEGPTVEFPHFMLLNLPGVMVMEALLYMWMNFYFLGMCRLRSDVTLEIGITEEEAQYVRTLLVTQYQQLKKITFYEVMVISAVSITVIFELVASTIFSSRRLTEEFHVKSLAPGMMAAVLLCVAPKKPDFIKFLKKYDEEDPLTNALPSTPSKACLNWHLVKNNMNWSVLIIIGGSDMIFEALRSSQMTEEFQSFLTLFSGWSPSWQVFVVLLFCKIFTEFASNFSVAYCMLPLFGRMALQNGIHPHYLMIAGSLSCSLPFHLVTGSPVNAMVAAYVHIPPWKMITAGLGPSLGSILINWFTAAIWTKTVLPQLDVYPDWAASAKANNTLNKFLFRSSIYKQNLKDVY